MDPTFFNGHQQVIHQSHPAIYFGLALPLIMGLIMLILLVIACLKLRRRQMGDIARLLWSIFLLVLPIAGPIIFFMVHPGELDDDSRSRI